MLLLVFPTSTRAFVVAHQKKTCRRHTKRLGENPPSSTVAPSSCQEQLCMNRVLATKMASCARSTVQGSAMSEKKRSAGHQKETSDCETNGVRIRVWRGTVRRFIGFRNTIDTHIHTHTQTSQTSCAAAPPIATRAWSIMSAAGA